MAVETLQDLIDLIETGPADVRQAAELVKRAVPQYPSATDLANADKFTLYKAGGTTEAIDGATLYSEVQAAHTVDSVAALRASSFPANLERLWLSGYYGVGTPGGGELYRVGSGFTSADSNDVTEFVDANGVKWARADLDRLTIFDAGGQNAGQSDQVDAATALINFNEGRKQTDATPEGPGTATEPVTYIPAGNYLLSGDMTEGRHRNTLTIAGEQSHLFDDPLRSVASAVSLAQDTSIDGIIFRGFVDQVDIDTGNVNQSTVFLRGNRFINPERSAINFSGNSSSSQVLVSEFQASLQSGTDAAFIRGGENGPDIMGVKNGFIQWDVNDPNIRHTCIESGGLLTLDNIICVPLSTVGASDVDAAWTGISETDDILHINACRFGGESGGATAVHCLSKANKSSDGSHNGIYINGGTFAQAGSPFIKFWKLPNYININGPLLINRDTRLHFVDATDSDADPVVGGIDLDALEFFANNGNVWVSDPSYLASAQYSMGDHAALGYSMVHAKYWKSVGLPTQKDIKLDDLLCAGDVIDGPTRSGSSSNLGGNSYLDDRNIRQREYTAVGSAEPISSGYDSGASIVWDNFLDPSIIGSSLDKTDNVEFTMLMEVEYQPVNAEAAFLTLRAAGQSKTMPLEEGYHTYELPFTYWNTSGAAITEADRIYVEVNNMRYDGTEGDTVKLGRIVFVRGFKRIDLYNIHAIRTTDVVPTDSDFVDSRFAFSGQYGWGRGDRVFVNVPGSGGSWGYICTTEHNTSAWASMGTI